MSGLFSSLHPAIQYHQTARKEQVQKGWDGWELGEFLTWSRTDCRLLLPRVCN